MSIDVGNFRLERTYPVPPKRLWHLLTDPRAREAWSGPSDDDVLVVESADVRVDGTDRHRCGPAGAPEWAVTTRWYHLEREASAAFTETLESEGQRLAVSLVAYDLAASGDGTGLAVHVAVTSFVGPEALEEFEAGWTSALGRLARLAGGEAAKVKEGAE